MENIYGYCRCSTSESAGLQSFDHQQEELIKHGVKPENIFTERISGTRENKPVLNKLLDKCEKGDTIKVYELSRISRSIRDFNNTVEIIKQKKLRLELIMNNITIDFTKDKIDPFTEFFLNILISFSSLEVSVIRERVKSGMAATTKKIGRPPMTKEKLENDVLFLRYYNRWKRGECNLTEMAKLYGHSRKNCREKIKIYEKED
ncbi:MAG: recombinase family protein [Candidatus Aphodocola sp.]